MYATPAFQRGAVIASVSAGPIFVLAFALTGLSAGVDAASALGAGLVAIVGVGVIAIPFGFMLSIVPNLIGAWILAMLGQGNDGVRLPVVWIVVGSLAAGLFAWAIRPSFGGAEMVVAFAATGGACALICRRFTRWP
jgi:hypothetical protein